MQEQIKSPFGLVWQRFKKNHFALFGLFIVGLTILIAIFSYQIIPDKTKYANQMCLQASMLSPGAEIKYIKTKSNSNKSATSKLDFFLGSDDTYQMIPITNYKIT